MPEQRTTAEPPWTPADAVLAECAASALRHAPASMRAAHMAPKLEELARRLREAAPQPTDTNP